MRDLPKSYSKWWSQHWVLGSQALKPVPLTLPGPRPPCPPMPPGPGVEAHRGQGQDEDHTASLGQSQAQNSAFSMAGDSSFSWHRWVCMVLDALD